MRSLYYWILGIVPLIPQIRNTSFGLLDPTPMNVLPTTHLAHYAPVIWRDKHSCDFVTPLDEKGRAGKAVRPEYLCNPPFDRQLYGRELKAYDRRVLIYAIYLPEVYDRHYKRITSASWAHYVVWFLDTVSKDAFLYWADDEAPQNLDSQWLNGTRQLNLVTVDLGQSTKSRLLNLDYKHVVMSNVTLADYDKLTPLARQSLSNHSMAVKPCPLATWEGPLQFGTCTLQRILQTQLHYWARDEYLPDLRRHNPCVKLF